MTFREEEKDRILAALETIAENTKPQDADNAQVIAEREGYKVQAAGLARMLIIKAQQLNEAMEDSDLLSRAQKIRECAQSMSTFGLRVEAALRKEQ